MEIPTDFNRERLCPCETCRVCYELVDFTEMLMDPEKCKHLDDEADIPEKDRDKVKLTAAVLIGAATEYGFRHGCPPDQLFQWMIYFWNKRASIAMHNVVNGQPERSGITEAEKRAEEYES